VQAIFDCYYMGHTHTHTHTNTHTHQLHPDAVQAILDYYYMGQVTIHGLDALLALGAAVHHLQVESMVELVTRKIVEVCRGFVFVFRL
jgi:hypothetical protein